MNIAFCDDDALIRKHIRETVCDILAEERIPANGKEYADAKELLAGITETPPDLLFLDIDLPDTDGVRFGEQLRLAGLNAEIVFISNMDDRVYDVFGIRPLSFIRKSCFDDEIRGVVKNFISLMAGKNTQILLHDPDGKMLSLAPDRIIYIESAGKLQKIFCSDCDTPIAAKALLRELDEQLTPRGFIRIHKGFLANYRFIQKITSRVVVLDNGISLPIGRDRLQEVRESYLHFMKRKGFGIDV